MTVWLPVPRKKGQLALYVRMFFSSRSFIRFKRGIQASVHSQSYLEGQNTALSPAPGRAWGETLQTLYCNQDPLVHLPASFIFLYEMTWEELDWWCYFPPLWACGRLTVAQVRLGYSVWWMFGVVLLSCMYDHRWMLYSSSCPVHQTPSLFIKKYLLPKLWKPLPVSDSRVRALQHGARFWCLFLLKLAHSWCKDKFIE